LLWDPEIPGRALDDDSVRAFIEQALIERDEEWKSSIRSSINKRIHYQNGDDLTAIRKELLDN
jgi:hypothetical protein